MGLVGRTAVGPRAVFEFWHQETRVRRVGTCRVTVDRGSVWLGETKEARGDKWTGKFRRNLERTARAQGAEKTEGALTVGSECGGALVL